MQPLKHSYAALCRPVRISGTVTLASVVRLDAIAAARGCRRGVAIADAVRAWTLREERLLSLARRLQVERVLRECEEWAPLDELLAEASQVFAEAA